LVHFSYKIWHLVAAILMIFRRISLPKFVQFKQYFLSYTSPSFYFTLSSPHFSRPAGMPVTRRATPCPLCRQLRQLSFDVKKSHEAVLQYHFQNPNAPRPLGRRRWNSTRRPIFYGSQDKTYRKWNFEFLPLRRAS